MVGLAGIGGLALTPSPPSGPPAVVAAVDDEVPFRDERIETEGASPIARFQYQPGGGFAPTAPINVVFPLADPDARLADVMSVLYDAGWTGAVEKYARYAWDRTRDAYVH